MKNIRFKLLILSLFGLGSLHAQLRNPLNTAFQNDMQKVVAEFPNRFVSLMGGVMASDPQTAAYASLVALKDAESCTVTRYSAGVRPIYSWQALMLRTDDFVEAAKKYNWLFHQLKGMNVSYVVDRYTLGGTYQPPAEERKFSVSELTVIRPPEALNKLRIEVAMQYEFPEWKVVVQVFEREREDDERGDISE
jgi:hypothetical protein